MRNSQFISFLPLLHQQILHKMFKGEKAKLKSSESLSSLSSSLSSSFSPSLSSSTSTLSSLDKRRGKGEEKGGYESIMSHNWINIYKNPPEWFSFVTEGEIILNDILKGKILFFLSIKTYLYFRF